LETFKLSKDDSRTEESVELTNSNDVLLDEDDIFGWKKKKKLVPKKRAPYSSFHAIFLKNSLF